MKDRDVQLLGNHLQGKDIALLVSGGIAAYKSPSLVRHFRQYGANVHVYLTPEAKEYVTERSLEWASTNPIISNLSSNAEHLQDSIDAYVIAPATYNTIGKFAQGIADNALTTTLTSALGRLEKGETSILLAPAMHGTMANSVYRENIEKLVSKGIKVIKADDKLGKLNLPKSHYIVVQTIRELSDSNLKGKNILITAGPTPGRIDNVRLMTNRFRGRLGINIADEAYMRGADVKLLLGAAGIQAPDYIDTTIIRDYNMYLATVMGELEQKHVEIGIFSAAVADYIPAEVREGKIPSQGALKSIPLKETIKVIKEVRNRFNELFMVTFKYEEGISKERLEEIAMQRVNQGYELVVANRGEEMTAGEHHSIIVDKTGVIARPSSKIELSGSLLDLIQSRILSY